MLKQFDIIQLITTKNIEFLSAPPGAAASPHGYWQVAGFVNGKILAVKDRTTALVPFDDIRVVGRYSISHLMQTPHKNVLDVAEAVSNKMQISIAEARRLILSLNLPLKATEFELKRIINHITTHNKHEQKGQRHYNIR